MKKESLGTNKQFTIILQELLQQGNRREVFLW